MPQIRGLELLFNIEKKNFKSAADCAVAALHSLLINEGLRCLGTGDEWNDTESAIPTELLPEEWNSDQDVYSLRYINKSRTSRVLLKVARADHMLLVNVVMNEDAVATMSFSVSTYVSENYEVYSSAYKNLDSLRDSFRRDIMDVLSNQKPSDKTKHQAKKVHTSSPRLPPAPPRPTGELSQEQRNPGWPRFPRVGGSDLDPLGRPGGGGMLMDPSSFGIPSRPTLPDFGVGGPGGLPRAAVPPGARFDPFSPPIHSKKPEPKEPHDDHSD